MNRIAKKKKKNICSNINRAIFFLNKFIRNIYTYTHTHIYIEKMSEFRNEEYDQLIKPIMITGKIISIWPLAENSSWIEITFRRFHLFCMFFLVSAIFDRIIRIYSTKKILQKFLRTILKKLLIFRSIVNTSILFSNIHVRFAKYRINRGITDEIFR